MAQLLGANSVSTQSMGYENPAFKIKIVAPTDALQQPKGTPRSNPSDDSLDNLRIGAVVDFKLGKKTVIGKISGIHKNPEGDGTIVEVTDRDGNKHTIDGSRINLTSSDDVPDDMDQAISSPGMFAESSSSRFMSFRDFSDL